MEGIFLSLIINTKHIFMKYLLFFLVPISLFAQDKFKVEYEKRVFIKLEGNNPQYRMMEEEFSKPSYIELLGDDKRCSVKQVERISNSQGPAVKMDIIGSEKDLENYLDFTKNEMIVSKDIDGKIFLITSKIKPFEWKISRELKKINGFNAKKATYEYQDFLYEVWFSTEIKSKCGPDNAYGLPGLLLEAKMIHREKPENYTQYKLNDLKIDNSLAFSVPTKGKPTTTEEYKKFREEYDKRLAEAYGNNGVDKD